MSFDSLSAWDRDKRKLMEGRRYQLEFDVGNSVLDVIDEASEGVRKVFIEGNHETRLSRYVEYHPELDGAIDYRRDLGLKARKWEFVPYKEYYNINKVFFTHIPFGKMREISGKDICSKAEQVTTQSVVFGHTHELHMSCVHKHGMEHLQQVLNVGCFFEKNADYVEGKMTNYWKGLIELDIYETGRFNINTISMGSLQRKYKA